MEGENLIICHAMIYTYMITYTCTSVDACTARPPQGPPPLVSIYSHLIELGCRVNLFDFLMWSNFILATLEVHNRDMK